MNADTLWQLVRYALLAGGGFLTGRGYVTAANWEAITGALAVIIPAAWGVYVKWNTTPVADRVVIAKDVATVSGATGAVVPPPSRQPGASPRAG